jgi:hypothetical protein
MKLVMYFTCVGLLLFCVSTQSTGQSLCPEECVWTFTPGAFQESSDVICCWDTGGGSFAYSIGACSDHVKQNFPYEECPDHLFEWPDGGGAQCVGELVEGGYHCPLESVTRRRWFGVSCEYMFDQVACIYNQFENEDIDTTVCRLCP